MTEKRIRDFAEVHGLEVLKRITTGNEHRHFATFELAPSGQADAPNVLKAWHQWRATEDPNRLRGERPLTLFHARSDANGLPWIELDSVWCELDD